MFRVNSLNKRLMIVLSVCVLAVAAWAFLPLMAEAQGGILPNATGADCSLGDGTKEYCGNYALNDFISLGINISRWILGIVASLTLLMFIWGGVELMISSGSQEKVAKGKKIIISAVIGLVIVFTSFMIIQFTMSAMGISWDGGAKSLTK